MLQPLFHKLSVQRIVLASGSPRRKEILENIGLKFDVVPSTFEENLDKSSYTPSNYVRETALRKTMEVASRLDGPNRPDLIIGADTVVVLDNEILEKPADRGHAYRMLYSLSGRSHVVHTGVVLLTRYHTQNSGEGDPFKVVQFHESTEVTFAELSSDVIKGYIDTEEPMDKAGGYGIQGIGGTLVSGIHGDYFNVMGFPLHYFCKQLVALYAEDEAS